MAWSPLTAVASINICGNYEHPVCTQLNYSDEPELFKRVCLSTLESRGIKLGADKLGVGSSGIEGAEFGLFSRTRWEYDAKICPCLGPVVAGEHECKDGGIYAVEADAKGWRHCVDMAEEKSCFARFANDRINEAEDNARPEMQEDGTIWLVAKCTIMPGDEITFSYGRKYWVTHWRVLSESARTKMISYFKVKENEMIYFGERGGASKSTEGSGVRRNTDIVLSADYKKGVKGVSMRMLKTDRDDKRRGGYNGTTRVSTRVPKIGITNLKGEKYITKLEHHDGII